MPTTAIKKKVLGIRPKLTLSVWISFVPEKHVSHNILGESANIFSALAPWPVFNNIGQSFNKY